MDYVEFYITNVCNFNCQGCNRFNNYIFSGSQKWQDYQPLYEEWSKRLDFDKCTILGGEPMAVSDYLEWLVGIRKLWPDSRIGFLTNGSLLKPKNRKLYDVILKHKELTTLEIGLHNRSRLQEVMNTVTQWLVGSLEIERVPKDIERIQNSEKNWQDSYERVRDASWPDCHTWHQWQQLPTYVKEECSLVHDFNPVKFADRLQNYKLTDSQGVKVEISWESDFHQGALIPDTTTGRFRLHDSDPEKAHAICHSKTCHHFESGKLYKCGQVSLFSEFYQQFHFDLSEDDTNLVHSYVPASLDMNNEVLQKWIDRINEPMPQCKFCPESYHIKEIFSQPKKIIFAKKTSKFD